MAMVCLAWLGKFRVALCLLADTGGVIGAAILGLTMPLCCGSCAWSRASAAGPLPWQGPMSSPSFSISTSHAGSWHDWMAA